MRTYLLSPDAATAIQYDARALSYLKSSDGAEGGNWSGVFTDGSRYGILYDACIDGAFTADELANTADDADDSFQPYTPSPGGGGLMGFLGGLLG